MTKSRSNRSTALDETKYLHPDEAARLRGHLDDEIAAALARGSVLRLRNALLAHVLLGTGLRISEAVALRVADLVLDGPRRMVRVRDGKGGKPRDVTISADLRNVLKRYLDVRSEMHDGVGPQSPLFAAGGGSRCMSRISGWRAWKRLLRAVHLDAPGRGCHAARHTRATLLYAATRDLRLVGRELGHSDVRTTTIYADVLGEDRIVAADAVDTKLRQLAVNAAPSKMKHLRAKVKPNSIIGGLK